MDSEIFLKRAAKPLVFASSLLPLLWLLSKAVSSGLGANPIEKVIHITGDWTLNFLLIILSITPLKNLTGWDWLSGIRRMIGLFAFFYACLHLFAYVWLDQMFSWDLIIEDVTRHKRIIVGFISFIFLLLLTVTSNAKIIERLGAARWKAIHRITYLVAIGGVIHYLWLVKKDIQRPLIYAGILLLLLGYRVIAWFLKSFYTEKPTGGNARN